MLTVSIHNIFIWVKWNEVTILYQSLYKKSAVVLEAFHWSAVGVKCRVKKCQVLLISDHIVQYSVN